MFRVSKWPYWSPPHDRITCKWRKFLPGGKKLNWKIISAIWRATGLKIWSKQPQGENYSSSTDKIITSGQIMVFEMYKPPYWSPQHDRIICKWHHFLHSEQKWNKKISQPFEELQGWNSEFKLITPKTISGTYSKTNLSRFGLAGFPLTAILDTLGQSRDHLGTILGLFWDYFGTILGQF